MKATSQLIARFLRRHLREHLKPFGFRESGRLLLRQERTGVFSIVRVDILRGTEASRLEFRVMFHTYHEDHELRITGQIPAKVPNLIYPSLTFEMSHLRGERATMPYFCENIAQAEELCKMFDELIETVALPILDEAADYSKIDYLRHSHPVIGRPPRDPEKDKAERARIDEIIARMDLKLKDRD